MPRTSEQFEQIKEDRKAKILNAATELFALANSSKISIDQISEKSQCSHGLIYHYFKNVDDVYNAILRNEVIRTLTKTLDVKPSLKALPQIKEILFAINKTLEDDKNIPLVMVFLDKKDKPNFKDTIATLVKKGQKENQVSVGDPSALADTCYYIYRGYCVNKYQNIKSNDRLPDYDIVMQLFLRGSLL